MLGFGTEAEIDPTYITELLDRSMLDRLADLVDDTTAAFDGFDYARALERTEAFFWWFTDNHMELVKARAYGEFGDARAESARHSLRLALSVLHRLFAPILPFVAEEVWSWWHQGSVHATGWPHADELRDTANGVGTDPSHVATQALVVVRRVKSENKRKLRTRVLSATFSATAEQLSVLDHVIDDVKAAGVIESVEPGVAVAETEMAVSAELEPDTDG